MVFACFNKQINANEKHPNPYIYRFYLLRERAK